MISISARAGSKVTPSARRPNAIQPHGAAQDGRIFGVAAFPEIVVQDGDRSRAESLIGRRKIASEERPPAGYLEGVGAGFGHIQALRKAAGIADEAGRAVDDRHALK